uniref:RZ-type domain-containing protein n=1 Tax=Clastoptera arizonana TaxID=38151 RepID=A0A1B6E310_9HEMI
MASRGFPNNNEDWRCEKRKRIIRHQGSDDKVNKRSNNENRNNFLVQHNSGPQKDLTNSEGQNENDTYKTNRPRKLGYHKLKDISLEDPMNVLHKVANSHTGFEELINSKPLSNDVIALIMTITKKICSTQFMESKSKMLHLICNCSSFLEELTTFIINLPLDNNEQNIVRIKQFSENFIIFVQTVFEMMPTVALTSLKKLLISADMAFDYCLNTLKVDIGENINKLRNLISEFNCAMEKKEQEDKSKKLDNVTNFNIKDNFREIDVYPHVNDILSKRPYIQKNLPVGPFPSTEHYLNIQFHLLREDFISPLRSGINEYIGGQGDDKTKKFKSKFDSVRVYKKVRFLRPKTALNKFGYEVCFDVENKIKNINWQYSKKFMFGSLLLFSYNHFQSFFIATVVDRNLKDLETKRISVELVHTENFIIRAKDLMNQNFEMVESEVYFEPYYNVLNALKLLHTRNFPFEKYIINADCSPVPPKYIQNNFDVLKIKGRTNNYTFHILEKNNWPTPENLELDLAQFNAFKAALTNEFTVIQGPPGTGKTFLGLRIAETLLNNSSIWNYPNCPIMVICYTNHALDQFLEGLIPITDKIIRIGGQSKNPNLAPYNLREKRMQTFLDTSLSRDLRKKLSIAFNKIKALEGKIEILEKNNGIISLKSLSLILHPNCIKGNFNGQDEHLIEWLLEGMTMRNRENRKLAVSNIVEKVTFSEDNIIYDQNDFENSQRMEHVYIDAIQLDKVNIKSDDFEVHYACLKNNIQSVYEEKCKLYDELPKNENLTRNMLLDKMRKTKKTIDDLKSLSGYLEKNLTNTALSNSNYSKHLDSQQDVWRLSEADRWALYNLWIDKLKKKLVLEMANLEENHRTEVKQYEEARQMEDLRIIKEADIVGITTTTAAKLIGILDQLASKIVIAEEAAEVLEAHIITSLTTHCQHLILIGDHKQLRPKPAEYKLAKEFHLDISLFERMINNNMAPNLLCTQHRMRPQISKLLVPTIYPKLNDHTSVHNRENIRGMESNLFFFNHSNFEEEIEEMSSKKNIFECKMIVALARHLILQGYKANEVTILATYKGQMFAIKKEWENFNIAPGLRITVVDNYQGEESKIILLSLVRSNKEGKIGFLKTDNRVCVALSRARDGLYIFGNMDNLVASSSIWPKIKESLEAQNALGRGLILKCVNHPDQLTRITDPNDFSQVIEGGCNQLCLEEMPCGHVCKRLCHVTNKDHSLNKCTQECTKLCPEGHKCNKRCFQTCGSCQVPVSRILPCNHTPMLPCSTDIETYFCKTLIAVKFKSCEHTCTIPCGSKGNSRCTEPCEFRLECGHSCVKKCHVNYDPDHLKYICQKPCSRKPIGCSQDHECKRLCHEECEPCTIKVAKTLDCGHKMTEKCNIKPVCRSDCNRLRPCGHYCKKKCKENCGNCMVLVKKEIVGCQHQMPIYCYLPPEKQFCKGECTKTLPCGHRCNKTCKEVCCSDDCVELVEAHIDLPCGHKIAYLPCNKKDHRIFDLTQDELLQYCGQPCGNRLECDHYCEGTCGQCMQGRIHKVCEQPCGNVLICNHSCPVPCRQICPPCSKPCAFKCAHSKCPKKCGEVCIPCKENCTNNCEHHFCKLKCNQICKRPPCENPCRKKFDCGHSCVGFCGEPCPPCKPCNPQEYEEFFFTGEETEEDAKFVLLEDCQHVFEVNGLTQWMNITPEGGEIVLKCCPKCKTVITKVIRFQKIIKTILADVKRIKEKAFGEVKQIRAEREELRNKLVTKVSFNGFAEYKEDSDQFLDLQNELLTDLSYVKNFKRNEIDVGKLGVFNFMVDFICSIKSKHEDWKKLNEESKFIVSKRINQLISMLRCRKDKISTEDVYCFRCELTRIFRLIDFLKIKSTPEYRTTNNFLDIVNICTKVQQKLDYFQMYTDADDKVCFNLLNLLQKEIKLRSGITPQELDLIFKGLFESRDEYYHRGSKAGHVFKCSCGYIYVVGNCGGANQIGRCPQCRKQIGTSDNRQRYQ